MARKTRIKFSSIKDAWYVEARYWFLFIPYWKTANKSAYYSSDDPDPRYFSNFDDARTFAIKMATDVAIEHKANQYDPLI